MTDLAFDELALFASLSPDERLTLAHSCHWKNFSAGENIIVFGDENTEVSVILEGQVHVLNYSEVGKAIDYATLREGDIFGELAAIDGLPRSAWVIAKTPCRIGTIQGDVFVKTMTAHPGPALQLLQSLTRIIRLGTERIKDVSLLSGEQRICLEILKLAENDLDDPDKMLIESPPNQADIANVVGLSRETVSRVMSKLSQDGIIQRKGRKLFILDREQLQDLAMR